jgi:hypothetical protein
VVRKLRRSLRFRSGHFACRQWTYPHSRGASAAGVGLTSAIVLENFDFAEGRLCPRRSFLSEKPARSQ